MIECSPSRDNRRWFRPSRPLLPALALSGALLFTGCRRAAVERFNPTVETRVTPAEPAVFVRPQSQNTADKDPWYRELQVVLDQPAANEQELAAKIEQQKSTVNAAVKKLLDDVASAVQDRKSAGDKWSILSITCGKARKVSDLHISADIGLTRLYAKRPVIAFNDLPLELCVAKLSREAGIHESQPKGYDPPVNWSQTDVSALEALEAVLTQHGFEHRLSDTLYKASVRVQDYATRQELIEGAAAAILAKGKALNAARPALSVTHKEKPAPPEAAPAPSKRAVPVPPPRK